MLKKIIPSIPKNIKVTIWFFLYMLVIYTLLRVGFYVSNKSFFQNLGDFEIFHSFVTGIRFDIAALLMLNLPLIVLFNFPLKIDSLKFSKGFFFILFCVINLFGIGFNLADYAYYPTIQRRLLFEPFTETLDIVRMFPGLFKNYAILILFFIALIIFFFWFTLKFYRKVSRKHTQVFSYWKSTISFIIIVLLTVIGIRGGLQLKPLRQTNAFFSDNRPLGYLTLNSTYTVIRCYFQDSFPEYNFLRQEDANLVMQSLLKAEDEIFVDEKYPFMRKINSSAPIQKRNVVLFIMESWSAEFIGSISGKETKTPFFDSIAKQGILFTNFLASGQRSIEAVPSILASVPAIFPASIIGSRTETNNFRGLGTILNEFGYTTSFHHGARSGSMGFDAFVPSTGFLKYFGKEDFSGYADSLYDGVWGIFDEPFFIDAANKINSFSKPFCSVVFSLSSHDPFNIPEFRKKLFPKQNGETDFHRAMRYSDFALQKFFEFAKKQDWFTNTIFIITADHTLYTARNDVYSSFHIPLLIFDPQNEKGKVDERVGSHVDILPTVLDLLNLSTIHSSMGKSLLSSDANSFSAATFYPTFLFFENTTLYVDDFEKKREFYLDFKSTEAKKNIYNVNGWKYEEQKKKLIAYVQTVSRVINQDLIYKK